MIGNMNKTELPTAKTDLQNELWHIVHSDNPAERMHQGHPN